MHGLDKIFGLRWPEIISDDGLNDWPHNDLFFLQCIKDYEFNMAVKAIVINHLMEKISLKCGVCKWGPPCFETLRTS